MMCGMKTHDSFWQGWRRRSVCFMAVQRPVLLRWVVIPLLGLFAVTTGAELPRALEFETGLLWAGRADVRIPGDEGTRFSLADELDAQGEVYLRGRATWYPAPRHSLAITAAPLEVSASGTLSRDTLFVDTHFPAGTEVDATYRFDSYRLTYRYKFWETRHFRADFGGTLFVRDAEITLEDRDRRGTDSDLGLVPLASFYLVWRPYPALALALDGDALAAPQGRALDTRCAVLYTVRDSLQLGLGYRILEGGADNDNVYTFALFHQVGASLTWRF